MTDWKYFKQDLGEVPSQGGVYLLGDSGGNVIYVGRTNNLSQRLLQHPDPNNPCLQRKMIRYFAYEATSNAEAREQELIRQYNPECNRG